MKIASNKKSPTGTRVHGEWGLTGYGGVESEGLQAGQLFAPGLLHAVAEDALPGVQLQQLDASQQLVGLLQTLAGVFLPAGRGRHDDDSIRACLFKGLLTDGLSDERAHQSALLGLGQLGGHKVLHGC